ncbi:hypothetical protein ABW19_dt0208757 [Dactylella cylindrospora]|nr:hypothetical protein ABW19_dt0208757 [Dactylella cylindrospora]
MDYLSSLAGSNGDSSILDEYAAVALDLYIKHPHTQRLLISISGIPGSGKTTFANAVVERLNTITQLKHGVALACCLPMDGFHYSRDTLDALPDPQEAHRRRGAPFTFDAKGIIELLENLKEPVSANRSTIIYAPSFDHALKDPVANDIAILPSQRIILVEGNYLCFEPSTQSSEAGTDQTSVGIWHQISSAFHEKWVIETPLDVASSRLALRHLKAAIVKTLAEGYTRANGSDKQNAEQIIKWRGKFDRKISGVSL